MYFKGGFITPHVNGLFGPWYGSAHGIDPWYLHECELIKGALVHDHSHRSKGDLL